MSHTLWKRLAALSAALLLADVLFVAFAVAMRVGGSPPAALSGALLALPLLAALCYFLRGFHAAHLNEARRDASERLARTEETAALRLHTIESLAIAIDAKDQTSHGHVRRSRVYAVELGKLFGLKQGELDALRDGALLHDIGKLAVPEYILNKPGKLTAAEFEKMKIHTTVGGDIVRRVNFPYPVEEVVRHHHEKWDGTGYPEGLRGEEIPLVARILSVVDFYDATRCDRPYRRGRGREETLAMLAEMAGTSFDPSVVEMFVAHLEQFETLLSTEDMSEQVQAERDAKDETARTTRSQPETPSRRRADDAAGFRSIAQAQREVFALHEIMQAVGSSLSLGDTASLVAGKLKSIVPFDTCVVYVVDEKTGRAEPVCVSGPDAEFFEGRAVQPGEGITGWVIANARAMASASPELELADAPAELAAHVGGVLSAPLAREGRTFGAVTLFAAAPYAGEHPRLLESACQHAASALGNALMHERTKQSALTDPLTELPNARALHLVLDQRVAECQRAGREPFALLCMDVDDFREFNERHGHGVGDRLLASVAAVCKNELRQMDVLARYDGDEFVAVMPTATADVAAIVTERLRAAVESHRFAVRTGHAVRVSLSVGTACFPADGETAAELLDAATRHMRRAKQARKHAPGAPHTDTVVPLDSYR
jgi:diguanylate cyclase (GGDEF)-like protein/putative nucleotidyltransferase with HDIG domain